jgi:2-keto-3-deoxygluconate permease
VLVAASVVVSAVLCPIVTVAWARRVQKKEQSTGRRDAPAKGFLEPEQAAEPQS